MFRVKMKKYFSVIVILLLSLTSCSDDNPSDSAVLFDIVCLEEDSENGSVFTLCRPGNDEVITLTTPQRLDTRVVAAGDRFLLMYVPESGEAYRSGAVTAKGYGKIVNGELTVTEGNEIEGWDREAVYLLSAWRAGKYLNMHVRLPYQQGPRDFTLAMPEIQADSSYPDIYLVNASETDVATFSRAYYASFDISALINDPQVEGFTLHLNNSNLNLDEIRFDKK